ncbi:MAG: septation protein IspZ [Alphaproteobacteria bacterium]|jgi:intracellular septation protein|nr:septation protein IspZ [Alphaproteobacteria bacterium]
MDKPLISKEKVVYNHMEEEADSTAKKEKKYPVILEIIPIFLFFALSKYYDIFIATGSLMITSFANLIVGYLYTKSFHAISVITTALAVIFGSLTLLLGNENFIKFKVTLMNVIFATVLISGYFFKRNFLKLIFRTQIDLTDKGWQRLNLYWIFFFLGLATLNEIIWRHFSTDLWVDFKAFGIFGLTFLFMVIQYPLVKKYLISKNLNPHEDENKGS